MSPMVRDTIMSSARMGAAKAIPAENICEKNVAIMCGRSGPTDREPIGARSKDSARARMTQW